MLIDVALCVKYLNMPEEHWQQALRAEEWMRGEAVVRELTDAALIALNRGDRDDAYFAMKSAKEYAARTAPEHAEGVVPMMFALALPQTIENLRREGMPEDLILDTLSDYGTWARYYHRHTGRTGIGEFGWEVNFHSGCIVKLGRIQFETCLFPAPYTIYRSKATGEIIPVLHDGVGVNADGFLAIDDEPAAFKSTMRTEGTKLTCNRVDTVNARVLGETVEYDLNDLELILTSGMRVLNMHIPEVGPLNVDGVSESLRLAKEYFEKKGYPCKVAVCESWLLDPALLEYGTAAGNILAFQNRFAKYPWIGNNSEAVGRVFGRGTDVSDPDALPADTGLRRGLRDYLKTGKPLRDAGGILAN